MLVQIKSAFKSFGSQELFKDLNLIIQENEKVALIGANGVGKTTLFNVLSGNEGLDKGDVFWKSGIRTGFLEQIHVTQDEVILKDFFAEAYSDITKLQTQLNDLEALMKTDHSDKILKSYDRIQTEFLRRGGYSIETEVHTLLTKFNFTVSDLDRSLNTFSGGQVTRLAFVRLLLSKPDILFLDEPTNHLDISTIEWLEGYLNAYDGSVVVVSHDRLFLDRVCNVVVEIEDYIATRYSSNYTGYQVLKEKDIERHNIKVRNQQKEIERIEGLIEKFRYKKNKAAFAQSKIKYLDRIDRLETKDSKTKEFKAEFKSQLRGGKDVLTLSDFVIGYDKPLTTVTQTFTRGRRYAIVGDNGTGKSTLLKSLSGRLEPLGGDILLGHQIKMGYFDQNLLDFSMNKSVLEEVWDEFPQLDHTEIRTALGQFLFKGEDVFKSVSVLSGGERVRLSLIKLMLRHDNLLVLDEPTNHLDIQGKEALEKSLSHYDGTMIFVSHDRYFIEKLATDILLLKDGVLEHTEMSMTDIVNENKQKSQEQKQTNKNEYVNIKKYKNRQKKLEEELIEFYEDLEIHRELRFSPDYYHDYEKMNQLNQTIDEIHNEIKHRENEWAEVSEILEEND